MTKLQAITVCINYVDYLECILANRVHFDRWLIMTAAGDAKTIAFCKRHQLEYACSRTLKEDGSDFDATRNKSSILNEGLELLDQDGWCLILDADVRVPRDFRRRLNALPLESGAIYGPNGRRICHEREMFDMLVTCEPWDRFNARYNGIIGFFQLFDLEGKINRYHPSNPVGKGPGDDDQFQYLFPAEKRLKIPMSVIHVGSPFMNWERRVTRQFVSKSKRVQRGTVVPNVLAGAAAYIGYYPGNRATQWMTKFDRVWLVDHFGVHAKAAAPLIESDREVLRALWAEEAADLENLRIVEAHSESALTLIADDSLDLLHLSGEVAPDWLCRALPHWLPKLKDGALITGDLYGLPHWPDGTHSLALLLGGAPERGQDGSWCWPYRKGERPLAVIKEVRQREEDGIGIVGVGSLPLEPLLITIHSARQHWGGAIQVFFHGEEDQALRIVCARLGVELRHCNADGGHAPWLLRQLAEVSPFRRGLFLLPGNLLTSAVNFEEMPLDGATGWGPLWATANGTWETKIRPAAFTRASDRDGVRTSIISYEGAMNTWSDEAWEKWCEMEAEATLFNASEVQLAPDATVVCVVTSVELGDFQRNWLTWRFPDGTPVLLLVQAAADSFWIPGQSDSVKAIFLPEEGNTAAEVVRHLTETVATAQIFFLPASAAAAPGAELWMDLEARQTAIAFHSDGQSANEFYVTGNRYSPRVPFIRVPGTALQELAGWPSMALHPMENFMPLLEHYALARGDSKPGNMFPMGWRYLGSEYRFHSRRKPLPAGCALRPQGVVQPDGNKRVAAEVVVISLPERTDRRLRIAAMLEHERIPFRFSDGVRVTPGEIKASEIANVADHPSKRAAGFERYLCGMVGCRRAHLRVLESAYAAGVDSVLVLEDDTVLEPGWLPIYQAALAELPAGWHQLYFSAMSYDEHLPVSAHLLRIQKAYATTAILYSYEGIEAALHCLRSSRCEIDEWYIRHLHSFGNSYLICPTITHQDGGLSDIVGVYRGVTA